MGLVKPSYIKNVGNEILENYPHMVSSDFEENKKLLAEVFSISKRYRNRLAGYLTRLKNKPE